MPQLGPLEVVVILVVALLVFGPSKLPEVGRQVGRGLAELRKLQDTVRAELNDALDSGDSAAPTLPPALRARAGTVAPTPARAARRHARTVAVPRARQLSVRHGPIAPPRGPAHTPDAAE